MRWIDSVHSGERVYRKSKGDLMYDSLIEPQEKGRMKRVQFALTSHFDAVDSAQLQAGQYMYVIFAHIPVET